MGWEYAGDNSGCLLMVKKALDWYSARKYCQNMGGDLPIIDTEAKQDNLGNHYGRSGSGQQHSMIWLGASDGGGGSGYVWVNGVPVVDGWKYYSHSHIRSNEEPGSAAAMCMFTYTNAQYSPQVNYCTHTLPHFLCQK